MTGDKTDTAKSVHASSLSACMHARQLRRHRSWWCAVCEKVACRAARRTRVLFLGAALFKEEFCVDLLLRVTLFLV